MDKILNCKADASLYFKQSFNLDVDKLMHPHVNYTPYHIITRNTHAKLIWKAHNFKETAKELLKVHGAFSELKYDSTEPFSLAMIGLLHLNVCQINMVFDNTEFFNSKIESKKEVIEAIKELQQ